MLIAGGVLVGAYLGYKMTTKNTSKVLEKYPSVAGTNRGYYDDPSLQGPYNERTAVLHPQGRSTMKATPKDLSVQH